MKEFIRDAILLVIMIFAIFSIYVAVAESNLPLWLKFLILK